MYRRPSAVFQVPPVFLSVNAFLGLLLTLNSRQICPARAAEFYRPGGLRGASARRVSGPWELSKVAMPSRAFRAHGVLPQRCGPRSVHESGGTRSASLSQILLQPQGKSARGTLLSHFRRDGEADAFALARHDHVHWLANFGGVERISVVV